ncbi:hypothetical protein FXO37_08708 [Capsicum annuum]|nr:hypothetical protein FXO37_08708 [Capsicum annuum]
MSFRRHKSKCEEAHNPWEREPKKPHCSEFNVYPQNLHLNIDTKKAALKDSPYVVSLESHSGGRSLNDQIEVYYFHYNIAAIKIQSDTPFPTASLVQLKDAITVDPCKLHVDVFLVTYSNSFDLVLGDAVIALRLFIEPYDIMAAPDEFRLVFLFEF